MLFVAVDRFLLVRYPQSGGLHRKWIPLTISWVVSFAFCVTTLTNVRIPVYFGKTVISCRMVFQTDITLRFRKIRILILLLSQYVLPLLIICVLYFLVWKTLSQRDVIGTKSESSVRKNSESKKKLIKMLVIVVAGK